MTPFTAETGRNRLDTCALMTASGATAAEIAKVVQCSLRTVYRVRSRPGFSDRVAAHRAAMVEKACGLLALYARTAAERLAALLDSKNEAVRLRAAQAMLHLVLDLRQATDFERRLAALESNGVVNVQPERQTLSAGAPATEPEPGGGV